MNWEWSSSLETGIDQIDEQHKELFNRIDKLELAIYKGQAASELLVMLEYLGSYIIEHFEMEEQIMLDHIYPDFAAHSRQHNEFRNIFIGILDNCKNRGADSYLAINVDKQMRKWWENHILKMDMAYIPFVKK